MTIPQNFLTAINAAFSKFAISNAFIQTAILSSIHSESTFVPKSEKGYGNTPNDRIRQIFTKRVEGYTDAQLTALKKDDVKFFDAVYGYLTSVGKSNGNTAPGDGYKYRGRGLNQITFKNNYKFYGDKIGVDLVNNPDRLNELPIAAAAAAAFFANGFATAIKNGLMKSRYGVTNVNDVKDRDTAVQIVLQTNAGWGNNIQQGFLATVLEKQKKNFDLIADTIKTNPGATLGVVVGLVGAFFFSTLAG
jgi:putative chitinase